MIRIKLLFIAILGSMISWLLIKTVLLDMNIFEFLAIEVIIGFSHYVYNDVKLRLK